MYAEYFFDQIDNYTNKFIAYLNAQEIIQEASLVDGQLNLIFTEEIEGTDRQNILGVFQKGGALKCKDRYITIDGFNYENS